MALLSEEVRDEIFNKHGYVYTKVRDEVPTHYGESCTVSNSLVADGCHIDGEVENSILFRGVRVAKGAKVSNCILMQDTQIGKNVELDYIISDKEVTVSDGRMLMGAPKHQLIISKGKTV